MLQGAIRLVGPSVSILMKSAVLLLKTILRYLILS